MNAVVFTLDLEDHRPDDSAELRFPAVTDELLDDLETWGVIGTVFVVGEIVRDHPDLVARVAARGHEVGLHGATHTPLPDVGAETFRTVTAEATDRLAQTIQAPVHGFRAPIFSLVPDSAWAPEILTELGFVYSSSVLPAHNPLYGWPGAPDEPFRWSSGLIEIPSPTFGFGPATRGQGWRRRAPKFPDSTAQSSPSVFTRSIRSNASPRPIDSPTRRGPGLEEARSMRRSPTVRGCSRSMIPR